MVPVREGDPEKPPVDPANPSEAIPLDDPFWNAVAFASRRAVELKLRMRARHEPVLKRWRSGDLRAKQTGVEVLHELRLAQDARNMREKWRRFSEEEARIGDAARWPGPIIDQVPTPSLRVPQRPTSADRAANYIGAVGGQIYRLAEDWEMDLCAAFRRPLHLLRFGILFNTESRNAWADYLVLVKDRQEWTAKLGVTPTEVVGVLMSIIDCECCGDTCEPLVEAVQEIKRVLRAKMTAPTTPTHVQDAYAASTWRVTKLGQGGRLRIDDGREITTLEYDSRSAYLGLLDVASNVIASRYSSSVESALLFLLCNEPLTFKVAQIDYQVDSDPTALARIVLTVDPTLSSEEVRSLYRYAREKVVEGRHVDTEEATMALAGFVYSQTLIRTTPTIDESRSGDWTEYDEGWRQIMDKWNAEQQEQPILGRKGATKIYKDLWRFRNVAEKSRDQLLNRRLKEAPRSPEFPSLEVFEDRKKAGSSMPTPPIDEGNPSDEPGLT